MMHIKYEIQMNLVLAAEFLVEKRVFCSCFCLINCLCPSAPFPDIKKMTAFGIFRKNTNWFPLKIKSLSDKNHVFHNVDFKKV